MPSAPNEHWSQLINVAFGEKHTIRHFQNRLAFLFLERSASALGLGSLRMELQTITPVLGLC